MNRVFFIKQELKQANPQISEKNIECKLAKGK